MWVQVLKSTTGTVITNASFSIAYYNQGDGWYFVHFSSYNQGFTCSAPGHNGIWSNNDTYSWMRVWLAPIVQPPPGGNCWS